MKTHPTLPADGDLRDRGLAPGGYGRVLVLGCGALAREILELLRLNRLDHVDLQCLPAILHNHPERITDAVEAAVAARRAEYQHIFVAYADCGTGGALADLCDRLSLQMIAGPHCYAFFEGLERFAAHEDEISAFYLTDFLARQFDAFVWRPLGLDRHPELREMYFGNYTKLVYLAQTEDQALSALARSHAERLGLAFEQRFTGFGELAERIGAWGQAGGKEVPPGP